MRKKTHSPTAGKKRYVGFVFTSLIFLVFSFLIGQTRYFESQKEVYGSENNIDYSEFDIESELKLALHQALSKRPAHLFPGSKFAVTNITGQEAWHFISLASLDGPDSNLKAVGTGDAGALVLAVRNQEGDWQVALSGTQSYSDLLATAPDHIIPEEHRLYLDPRKRSLLKTPTDVEYKFPWAAGEWEYRQGWHASALDIGTRGTDKRVLAAADGLIGTICDKPGAISANVQIIHEDGKVFDYVHLDKNSLRPNIQTNKKVKQGQILGDLLPGTWSFDGCGYTEKQDHNSAHLHWVMPTGTSLIIDGWTIQSPNNTWRKGDEVRFPTLPYQTLPSTNKPVEDYFDPVVDAFLLVDLSASFADDLAEFKQQAPNIINALDSSYDDVRFGLARFEDYPISPFGSLNDKAYERIIDLTEDKDLVLNTISGLGVRNGADFPESQLPALYQAVTGSGQDLSGFGFPNASIPPGQQASFREESSKIILLWTDAPFHRPLDFGAIPYPGPSFAETINAIGSLSGSKVVGIFSFSSFSTSKNNEDRQDGVRTDNELAQAGIEDLQLLVSATGSLAPEGGVDCDGNGSIDILAGEPLVCTISTSGIGIGMAVISLVEAATKPTNNYLPVILNEFDGDATITPTPTPFPTPDLTQTPTSTPEPTFTLTPAATSTSTATPAGGRTWQEVGSGSAGGGGISNNNGESGWPAVAAAPDGTVYVAWYDNSSGNNEIYVKRWNGSSWQEVGSGSAAGGGISKTNKNSKGVDIAVAPDGTPYVVWRDWQSGKPETYVKRWNGASWEEVGAGSASGGGISNLKGVSDGWPSIAIAPDGTPYVAWDDGTAENTEIFVRRWNGSAWEEVGSGSGSGGGISSNSGASSRPSVAIAPDGTPYITWYDLTPGNYEIYVKRFNGSVWVEVGAGSAQGGGISNNSGNSHRSRIAIAADGTPYVTWFDNVSGDFEVFVKRWSGSTWQEVGSGSAQGGGISNNSGRSRQVRIALSASGRPYIAWYDDSSGDNEIYVRFWDGSTWAEAGGGSATGGGISDNNGFSSLCDIAVAPDGTPYVAWGDNSSGDFEIYVKRWAN